MKKVALPKGFLNSLPKKLREELETHLKHFYFKETIDSYEYRELTYYRGIMVPVDNLRVIGAAGNYYEVEFQGAEFVENDDSKNAEIYELYRKASELDKLKNSLANIKTVLGEIK